jgi:hypothetical protein
MFSSPSRLQAPVAFKPQSPSSPSRLQAPVAFKPQSPSNPSRLQTPIALWSLIATNRQNTPCHSANCQSANCSMVPCANANTPLTGAKHYTEISPIMPYGNYPLLELQPLGDNPRLHKEKKSFVSKVSELLCRYFGRPRCSF